MDLPRKYVSGSLSHHGIRRLELLAYARKVGRQANGFLSSTKQRVRFHRVDQREKRSERNTFTSQLGSDQRPLKRVQRYHPSLFITLDFLEISSLDPFSLLFLKDIWIREESEGPLFEDRRYTQVNTTSCRAAKSK